MTCLTHPRFDPAVRSVLQRYATRLARKEPRFREAEAGLVELEDGQASFRLIGPTGAVLGELHLQLRP